MLIKRYKVQQRAAAAESHRVHQLGSTLAAWLAYMAVKQHARQQEQLWCHRRLQKVLRAWRAAAAVKLRLMALLQQASGVLQQQNHLLFATLTAELDVQTEEQCRCTTVVTLHNTLYPSEECQPFP